MARRADVPRAVIELCVEQEPNALRYTGSLGLHGAALDERGQAPDRSHRRRSPASGSDSSRRQRAAARSRRAPRSADRRADLQPPSRDRAAGRRDPRWSSVERCASHARAALNARAYSAFSGAGAYACSERMRQRRHRDIARFDRRTMRRHVPAAVGELTPLHEARQRIGGRSRAAYVRCGEPGKDVGRRIDAARDRDVLQFALAPALEIRRASWSSARAPPPRQRGIPSAHRRGGHLEQAVVVARDAAGRLEEHRVGVLQQRQAGVDGARARIAAPPASSASGAGSVTSVTPACRSAATTGVSPWRAAEFSACSSRTPRSSSAVMPSSGGALGRRGGTQRGRRRLGAARRAACACPPSRRIAPPTPARASAPDVRRSEQQLRRSRRSQSASRDRSAASPVSAPRSRSRRMIAASPAVGGLRQQRPGRRASRRGRAAASPRRWRQSARPPAAAACGRPPSARLDPPRGRAAVCVISRSSTAHISAVAPASLRAFGSAPRSSSSRSGRRVAVERGVHQRRDAARSRSRAPRAGLASAAARPSRDRRGGARRAAASPPGPAAATAFRRRARRATSAP